MNIPNNHTVLDLSKCQHGTFYYVNQYGQQSRKLPESSSVRLQHVNRMDYAFPHPDYPGETEWERAKRLELLDVWKPVVVFQLTANHSITYTGNKAIILWKAFNARIFSKRKQK